jgi:hypothetical protein
MSVYAKIALSPIDVPDSEIKILYFPGGISNKYLVRKPDWIFQKDFEILIGNNSQSLLQTTDPNHPKVKFESQKVYDNDLYPESCFNSWLWRDPSNENLILLSPWEFKNSKTKESQFPFTQCKRKLLDLLRDKNKKLKLHSKYFHFIERVDLKEYPNYYDFVPVMICLDTICKRVENEYYRSTTQLLHDVKQIAINSYNFNTKQTQISIISRELRNRLIRSLQRFFAKKDIECTLEDDLSTDQDTNRKKRKHKKKWKKLNKREEKKRSKENRIELTFKDDTYEHNIERVMSSINDNLNGGFFSSSDISNRVDSLSLNSFKKGTSCSESIIREEDSEFSWNSNESSVLENPDSEELDKLFSQTEESMLKNSKGKEQGARKTRRI